MDYKKICYLVLVYNELEYTIKTFESLLRQKQDKYHFDIICVDNASDETYAVPLHQYCCEHNIRYLRHDVNDGYAGGNNYAYEIVKLEGYEIVFIANNDIELLHPNITENVIDCFKTNDKIALVGAPNVDKIGNYCQISGFAKLLAKLEKQPQYKNEIFKTEPFVVGCFFAIRTNIKDLEFLFDYSYFMYDEEKDLEFRLMRSGYYIGSLCIPNMIIKHYGADVEFQSRPDWFIYLFVRNYILSSRKYRFLTKVVFYILYSCLVVKNAFLYRKNTFRGYWAGIYLSLTKKSREYIYEDAIEKVKTLGRTAKKNDNKKNSKLC